MDTQTRIERFLDGTPHAVVGASTDRAKYGNKVLRAFLQQQRRVFPVHPQAGEVEGLPAYRSLRDLPESVHGISIITPPRVTESIVAEALELGIKHIWMQPGAESEAAMKAATEGGINLIAGGPCLLVAMRFREKS